MESCRCPISCREIFGKGRPRPSPWLAATPDGRGTARSAAGPRLRPRQTALRETFEEVGIPADRVEILGQLPDVDVTVSGFRVTPYVGVTPHPYSLRPSTDEIEETVQVPLAVFRDPSNLRIELRERDGRPYEVYHFTYGVYDIWGATARIIKHLVDLVGRE